MIELSRRPGFAAFLSAVQEPQIVLAAVTRLRWLAVVGQVTATAVAVWGLRLNLPLSQIFSVILLTAVSNSAVVSGVRFGRPPAWMVQAVLLLDVFLLSALLYFTGGPDNPFASLYLVHVAMAVIVLRSTWTWVVVGTVAICYGLLFNWHQPLGDVKLPMWARATGSWIALVLVSVLIAVFIGQVIRSLRQRERELASVRERAARNEQLAALTTLAAGAAHELNTPLGTIAVVARELELSCSHPDAVASSNDSTLDDARLIRREVDRCRAILSRMRLDIGEDVSRRSVVRVDDLICRLRESLSDNDLARLQISTEPGLEAMHAPPRAIEQSLLVLIRNAFDASSPLGKVKVGLSVRDGHARFTVQDYGNGMSPEMLRRAGEPFFTTKEPGKGMGLGLYLVRLVAEQCGATFSIDSSEGKGTTSVLEFTIVDAAGGERRQ